MRGFVLKEFMSGRVIQNLFIYSYLMFSALLYPILEHRATDNLSLLASQKPWYEPFEWVA